MSTYREHAKKGPFPGQIDPWAEKARYFQQIHSGMIDHILEQISDPLFDLGYIAGKETSLQIIEGREPDVYVREQDKPRPAALNYEQAATAIHIEAGTKLENESPELQAIHITQMDSGDLVTVVEVVSPRNKTSSATIQEYQEQRYSLFLNRGVNVVEIDATRSYNRLLDHPLVGLYPYHIIVYLPEETDRILGSGFDQPLSRFALPLRKEVLPVDTHAAYTHAYQLATIAGHILKENQYAEKDLPFPTLLTEFQRDQYLKRVQTWREELERLKPI